MSFIGPTPRLILVYFYFLFFFVHNFCKVKIGPVNSDMILKLPYLLSVRLSTLFFLGWVRTASENLGLGYALLDLVWAQILITKQT